MCEQTHWWQQITIRIKRKETIKVPRKYENWPKPYLYKEGVFFTFPNNASLLRKYQNCSSPKEYNTNNSVRKIPKRNPEQIRIQMMRGRRRPPGKGRLIWMQCTITLHTRHLPFLSTFSDFFPSTMNLILFDKSRWAYLGPHWTYGDMLTWRDFPAPWLLISCPPLPLEGIKVLFFYTLKPWPLGFADLISGFVLNQNYPH